MYFYKIGKLDNSLLLFASISGGYVGEHPFWPAFQLFKDNLGSLDGFLRELVRMDVPQASSILDSYEHLFKYPFSPSEELYFGMCVKSEDLAAA